ncbi:MAG: sulfur carrier protein ThiS [Acidobacteria bacterium]|nr:sulfur carrier protein ThiS [Acidobacteriota bacterium]
MIVVNGVEYEYEGVVIEELIALLGVEPRGIAVARNGEIVRRSEWVTTVAAHLDHIEIVTAAAGG